MGYIGEFKIEKAIPLPSRIYRGGLAERWRWPFDEMEIGDSFLVQEPDKKKLRLAQNNICNSAKSKGFWVETRKVPEGLRVWMRGLPRPR